MEEEGGLEFRLFHHEANLQFSYTFWEWIDLITCIFSDAELDSMLSVGDVDGDGRIDYEG